MVKITYYGHACFVLESEGYRIALDPYMHGMVPGLPDLNLEAHMTCCSHFHKDHDFLKAVRILPEVENPPYTAEQYLSFHDEQWGEIRGKNRITVFQFGNLRVAHLGDQGCMPWADIIQGLKGVDCLMIPVGGHYTIDPQGAKEIIDAVQPRVCIPMHYRTDDTGFDVLAHISEFIQLFPEVQECDNSFLLTEETPKQILVMNYKP